MPRVKRGVTARARHKKVLEAGQGLPRPPQERLPHRQAGGDEGGAVRLPRPPQQEARVPRAVDRPHQRGGARARHDLQRVHDRPEARPSIDIDRKVLADMAVHDKAAFAKIVEPGQGQAGCCARELPAAPCSTRRGGLQTLAPFRRRHAAISNRLVDAARAAFAAPTPAALENAKARFLGKTGALTELLKGTRQARPPEERKARGAAINAAKQQIEAALDSAPRRARRRRSSTRACAAEALDVTLPGRGRGARRHASGDAAPGSASRRSSARSASTSPTAPRSRPTGTTSPRSTTRRTIRRARCRTRSTSTCKDEDGMPLLPAHAHQPDAGALRAHAHSRRSR